ncbi:MAG TPA: hypothetical protein VE057_21560 [Archangium sp.]|nr:hypothetical protein [Archangium sp.]
MFDATLFRLAAAAALLAGAMRMVVTFTSGMLTANQAELVYLLVDLLAVFALMGIYFRHRQRLGFLGLAAFAVALSGAASIVGPDGTLFGASLYGVGSILLLTGLAGLGALMLRVHGASRLAPTLWIAAWLCVLASPTFALLAQVGGFLYGLGLFIAGTALGSGLPGGDSKRPLP